MKFKIILLFILFSLNLAAQTNYKALILPSTLSLLSGATWGLHEATSHHWNAFNAKFPHCNGQFWNPEISWRNKYIQGNPDLGRKKFLGVNTPVQFTDAKHLLATSNQVFGFAAGISITIGKKVGWKQYALRIGSSFVAYSLGNYLTYNILTQ